jgi:hypothetical protein
MSRLAYIPWAVGVVLLAYLLAVEAAIQAGVLTIVYAKRAFRFGYDAAASVDPR